MSDKRIKVDVTYRAILKVLITLLAVWVWFRVWQFAVAFLVSILVAVAVAPLSQWLERRRWPRWAASSLPILLLTAGVIGFVMVAGSSLQDQALSMAPKLEGLEHQVRESTPLASVMIDQLKSTEFSEKVARYASALVASALRALLLIGIGLILTVYLLIEREKTIRWVMAFVPVRHRGKTRLTLREVSDVMYGYVLGNAATSLFAAVFVFASLSLLHVPAALLLALLAGLCDFVPVLGFVVSGVPAVMLGATISPAHAVGVAALYGFYHFVENYFIAPRIYGDRLALSNVAVLLAFAAGAELGGVIGALLALPVAAMYPTVERLWWREQLGETVVEEHEELLESTDA